MLLLISLAAYGLVSRTDSMPIPHGEWKQWRGNPQHTGYQSLPGKIETPAILWRYRLGGRILSEQVVLCAGQSPQDQILLVAPPGRLEAYTLNGERLWTQRHVLLLNLLGCWDVNGDGQPEIVAGTSNLSGAQLGLFDRRNGELLWISAAAPGQLGAIKVVDIAPSGGRELLWAPAASSAVYAYAFPGDLKQPRLLWQAELKDYVSDPYSFSSIAVGDIDHDGHPEVVIAGGRGQVPVIILDAATGAEKSRSLYTDEVTGAESGGTAQLLQLRDVDGTGRRQIILISNHGSADSYMFQGIAITNTVRPEASRLLDTHPVGLRYARGSAQDFNADGRVDILVSQFDPATRAHTLILMNAADLSIEAEQPNFYLLAVADVGGDGRPFIIGRADAAVEQPEGEGPLIAYQYDGREFMPTDWHPGEGRLASPLTRAFDEPEADNVGDAALTWDADGDGEDEILIFQNQATELLAVDARRGAPVARFRAAQGMRMEVLAAHVEQALSQSRVVVGTPDGTLILLDGRLNAVNQIPVGGYYRNEALNGHTSEVALVADLDGDGRNELLAVDSRHRLLRLTGWANGAPASEVMWDSGVSQELLAVPAAGGGAHVVVRGLSGKEEPLLGMLDATGNLMWEHVFRRRQDSLPENVLPGGLNYGRFNDDEQWDVVASAGGAGVYPMRTFAFDGRSGVELWESETGTYWDATIAVWDVNGDKVDDPILNYNIWKAFILDGRTGQKMSEPVVLPEYRDLGHVDYNGAPAVVGGTNPVRILNAEDDGHLALLTVGAELSGTPGYQIKMLWAADQSAPDDERYSMAAIAPTLAGEWLAGVGSQQGKLRARRGSTGTVQWEVTLWGGVILTDAPPRWNALSSVAAVDVDGNGRVDFVVGGADGWLYAVEAETGRLIWSLDLGAPVGDPIAADIDQDGLSDVLVPAGDGYLYAIGAAR